MTRKPKTPVARFFAKYRGKVYELVEHNDGDNPCSDCAFQKLCERNEKDAETFKCPCSSIPDSVTFKKVVEK